ncbi:MAG TPA: 16S rRNA (cytosine(967)-C(5))-methyltransferase RsmB [Dyella sp.]|uniref:16S rRNA (cytosine(967)-C(5))-methyltransferase RsmB n=1 Tax=Dyella sp. TaxID=1869338 RepID=UPI002F94F72F
MNDVRAFAAQALADVALRGASLRDVMERQAPRLADPRDRALLMALVSDGARWWLRFDAAINHLLERPLRDKEPRIHALLVLGLVQLEILRMPDYAAVAATVQAARSLKRPQLAGLVNAVLRRWQREREKHLATLDAQPRTRHAHPGWLAKAIAKDWPAQAEAVMAANNNEPPLMLRANARRVTREALIEQMLAADYEAHPHPWLRDGIVLPHSSDVTRMPGFAQGLFAVQDGAAQIAADLLDACDGQRVLDACAAPGGKACHVLERAKVALTAVEYDPARAERIRQNLDRLGLNANLVIGDAGDPEGWWDGMPFDRIMIDAPCSATGVLRRRPDVRLHRRDTDIAAMAEQQQRILASLWPMLAIGGRLVYVTCSLLRAENESVVQTWLAGQPDAHVVPFELPVGQAAAVGWQVLPGDGDLDGMYYAVLEKR